MSDRTTSESGRAQTSASRRTDTRHPHRARERALKILFQADVRGVSPVVTLQRLVDEPDARAILDDMDEPGPGEPLDGFTQGLVLGVFEDRARIDELISRFARKWQISRMPVVDRTVLRLATYELIHEPTSPAIVIDEAVGLAKAMSTDDSGRYVNGVLESIRKELAQNPLPARSEVAAPDEVEPAADVPDAPDAADGPDATDVAVDAAPDGANRDQTEDVAPDVPADGAAIDQVPDAAPDVSAEDADIDPVDVAADAHGGPPSPEDLSPEADPERRSPALLGGGPPDDDAHQPSLFE